MRQMAEEKDTITAEARAPLQKQLQVTPLLNWMPFANLQAVLITRIRCYICLPGLNFSACRGCGMRTCMTISLPSNVHALHLQQIFVRPMNAVEAVGVLS